MALLIALAVLALWEGLTRTGVLSALLFPAPTTVLRALGRLLRTGKLTAGLVHTVSRLVAAFTVGGLSAAALGLSMGWSSRLRSVIDPLVAAVHPVPKTALFPVLIIVFGLGESSKVAVAALAAFFPVLINAMAGVRQISPIHFEVARNYGAGPLKVFRRVVLPGSMPMLLAGARLAFNSALVVTIAVEMIAAHEGLGAMIWSAWETMRTEELYAAIAVTACIGVVFNFLLKSLTQRLVPWQVEQKI